MRASSHAIAPSVPGALRASCVPSRPMKPLRIPGRSVRYSSTEFMALAFRVAGPQRAPSCVFLFAVYSPLR